jgi:hypothetical protein
VASILTSEVAKGVLLFDVHFNILIMAMYKNNFAIPDWYSVCPLKLLLCLGLHM